MTLIFHIFIEIIYYLFIALIVVQNNVFSMISSVWILMFFSILLSITLFMMIYFFKDRKKYFILSTIYIISICSIFFIFGKYILDFLGFKSGIINFTIYLYKILFMLSPFISLFFLKIHKLFYKKEKKQLYFIIASKRIIPILVILGLKNILHFSNLIYFFAITEFIFNILPLYKKKNFTN